MNNLWVICAHNIGHWTKRMTSILAETEFERRVAVASSTPPAELSPSEPDEQLPAAAPCDCGGLIFWFDGYGGGPHCHTCKNWPLPSLVVRLLAVREAEGEGSGWRWVDSRGRVLQNQPGEDRTWETYWLGDYWVRRRRNYRGQSNSTPDRNETIVEWLVRLKRMDQIFNLQLETRKTDNGEEICTDGQWPDAH